jgi:hypothetical protein
MPSANCHFCAHANPAGSKFCNQCGSPLDLKPCAQCEAMNHIAVDRCYQCGAPFAAAQDREFAEVAASAAGASAGVPGAVERGIESASPGQEPANPLPDRIPVVLSQRMDPASRPADALRHARVEPRAAAQDLPGAQDDAWIDSRRSIGTARETARVAERRRATGAAFAAVAVCAIVGAGYYAYQAQMLPRVADVARALRLSNETTSEAAPAASAATSPSATAGASPASTALGESTQGSTAAAPAAIAPATSAATTGASAAGEPTEAAPASAIPPASAPASASGAAASASTQPLTSKPASRTSRRRNVPRSAVPPSTPDSAAQPATDKDAAATQRLIERDLGPFLPPERMQQPAPR